MAKHLLMLIFFSTASCVTSINVTNSQREILSRTEYFALGEDFILECDINIEDGKELYSIKWYRNDEEFYTYKPKNPSSIIRARHKEGLRFDIVDSGKHSLRVKNSSFATSGEYKCEASFRAPSYETRVKLISIQIVDYPDNPVVSGIKDWYMPGDEVYAECSYGDAFPPPSIQWWINGESVNPSHLEVIEINTTDYNRANDITYNNVDHNNVTSHLRFVVDESQLKRKQLTVKCTVELLDLMFLSSPPKLLFVGDVALISQFVTEPSPTSHSSRNLPSLNLIVLSLILPFILTRIF